MASNAKGYVSATVFDEMIRTRFNGGMSRSAGLGEKWIHKVGECTTGSSQVFKAGDTAGTNDNFISGGAEIATGDKVFWIAIKHSGVLFRTATPTLESILFTHTGATPAFGGTGATSSVIIGPGELYIARLNGVTVADLNYITCKTSGSIPNAVGSSGAGIECQIAALLEDIA